MLEGEEAPGLAKAGGDLVEDQMGCERRVPGGMPRSASGASFEPARRNRYPIAAALAVLLTCGIFAINIAVATLRRAPSGAARLRRIP